MSKVVVSSKIILPLILFFILLLTGCINEGNSETQVEKKSGENIERILIIPNNLTLTVGEQLPINAKAFYSDGTSVDVTSEASWESGDKSILTIENGRVSALGKGTTFISSSLKGASATISVTINEATATLSKLEFSNSNFTVQTGQNLDIKIMGSYTDGKVKDVTNEAICELDNESIATFQNGVISALGEGETKISCELNGISVTNKVTVLFKSDYEPGFENIIGNTVANINNGGSVATQGDWIYYANRYADSGVLYKVKKDGSDKTVLDERAGNKSINVVGDWIYYIDQDFKVVKIRTDGGNKKVLPVSASKILVIGDWIFTVTSSYEKLSVDRMTKDGLQRKTLCSNCDIVDAVGDWVYLAIDGENEGLYKFKSDGSGKQLVQEFNVMISGVQIAYQNKLFETSRNFIYAYAKGEKYQVIAQGEYDYIDDFVISPSGDLFYGNGNLIKKYNLFTGTVDGVDKPIDVGGAVSNINTIDNWLYFTKYYDDRNEFWKVKMDGTELQQVI
ncbi:DUF5050 domain-containing protein [Cohnella massiliensis]|uniref:DUF5050 domain-containing protein n=1 Tax=Cohnella massiliensis TaxID=1816691 RepID=UPI0009BACC7D|nr:DUF5050 domain-containing protein [Cohnella massiliensis]